MNKLSERMTKLLELPGELADGVTRLTLTGAERVLIENHKGLLDYTEDTVEVSGGRLRLRVRGEDLILRGMNGEELLVTGHIFGVEVEGG